MLYYGYQGNRFSNNYESLHLLSFFYHLNMVKTDNNQYLPACHISCSVCDADDDSTACVACPDGQYVNSDGECRGK